MKVLNLSLFSFVFTVALLSGCQKNDVTDFSKIQGSDQKTEAAERLLHAGGFMHAEKQFDEALALNPQNPKARFYKAALGLVSASRGIVRRVEPLASKMPATNATEFAKWERELPPGDTRTFLLDGSPDITNERDAQAFVRTLQGVLRNIRAEYALLNKENFTLHIPRPKPGYSQSDVMARCPVTQVGQDKYVITPCDLIQIADINVSFADIEALRLYAAATIVYLATTTTYDLTGLLNVINNLQPSSRAGLVSDRDLVAAVKKESQLGILVDGTVLKEILSFGSEGLEAAKIAFGRQRDFCPTGKPNASNRPGTLISEGFCFDPKTTGEDFALFAAILKGPTPIPVKNSLGVHVYQTAIDVTRPLSSSVVDIKTELPTTFNACGDATSIPDNTLGGLFPGNDATKVLQIGNPSFLNSVCPRLR